MVYEIKTYQNESGQTINARVPADGGAAVYFATFIVPFMLNTPHGQRPHHERVDMPLVGETADEAFADMPHAEVRAKEEAERQVRDRINAEQTQRLIVTKDMPHTNGHAPKLRLG